MKRFFLALHILALSPFFMQAQTIRYASPTGNAALTGTDIANPTTLVHAISLATAGTTIYLRGGTYPITATVSFNKTGSVGNHINLWAYPGDTRPIIDGSAMAVTSSNRGLSLSGSYCHFKGFDIFKAGDNGLNVSGSNNIIEFCYFYENGDTGLQMGGGASNNQVINCDSYYNVDPSQGNADGFAAKLDVGTGNSFTGCRAWQNSDDGWDGYMRPSDDVSTTLDNCWAFKNGYLKSGAVATSGNGNGFKMGGSDLKDLRHNFTLTRCLAFQNKVRGFDQNNNKGSIILQNCTSWNNGQNYGMNSSGVTLATGKVMTLTNCISLTTASSNAFNVVATFATNSWTSGFTVSAADFQSIDPTAAYGPRQADGSLPNISFMHLTATSVLRNRGTNVSLPFNGTAPDLGAFETSEPIPVTLLSFFATAKDRTNVLNWTTVTELNNAVFIVERSANGVDFVKILNEIKGAGTTSTPQYYTVFDDNLWAGIHYYRLRQRDFDGKETISKTVAVNNTLNTNTQLKVYPSVSKDILTVETVSEGTSSLNLTDIKGQTLLTKIIATNGAQTTVFDTHNLPTGLYLVTLLSQNGQTTTKFVKE